MDNLVIVFIIMIILIVLVIKDANIINYFIFYEFQSKKNSKFFWVSAAAPLTSVVLASILVYLTHAENHGVQVV